MSTETLPMDEEARAKALREKQLKDGNHILMFAPGDRPVLVSTTHGGHTIGVAPRTNAAEIANGNIGGTPVHTRFQTAALQRGCVPESMLKTLDAGPAKPEKDKTEMDRVIDAIDSVMVEVEADTEGTLRTKYLTGEGRPDAQELSRRVGFKVSATLRDEAFEVWQNGGDD